MTNSSTHVVLAAALLLAATSLAKADDKRHGGESKPAPHASQPAHQQQQRPSGPPARNAAPSVQRRETVRPAQPQQSVRTNRPGEGSVPNRNFPNRTAPNVMGGRSRPDVARPNVSHGPENRAVVHNAPPARVYRNPSGTDAHIRPDGHVQSVHARGMTIDHGPGGRMVVQRPDHSVIVTNRAGHGYVQRPFAYRGHEFVNRTYYVGGRTYVRYYRPYTFHGVILVGYTPVRFYRPAFYGWAYNPWARPVYYRWGWMGAPWYGYYGWYFAPAPYYPSAAFWLADYLISAQLAAAYQENANAAAMAQQQAMQQQAMGGQITPELRQAIADEVQRQMAIENQQSQLAARNQMDDPASSGIPRLLSDGHPHVFVASYNLEVTASTGQMCTISRGDVLRLDSPPPSDSPVAYVQVAATRSMGCPKGSTVAVELTDLQDMHNQMLEAVNQGMSDLQTQAGQNGLPAMPAAAAAPPVAAPFAESAPPPDSNVATELTRQVQEADRVESEVLNEARVQAPSQPSGMPPPAVQPAAPAPQTTTISNGQTIDEVVAALGNPQQIIKAGKKEIYIYSNLKITFEKGKVKDVE